jgi:uncharacterized membrane protein
MTLLALASVIDQLVQFAAPWKDAYDDSTALSVALVYVHLASLLVGGGLALAIDRGTLRAAAAPAEREHQLAQMGRSHRTVIGAVGLAFLTGVLLFLADVETYAASAAFWTKMGLVTLLLLNGFAMTRLEDALRRGPSGGGVESPAWRRMRASAVASAALWLATLLAGVVLTNA